VTLLTNCWVRRWNWRQGSEAHFYRFLDHERGLTANRRGSRMLMYSCRVQEIKKGEPSFWATDVVSGQRVAELPLDFVGFPTVARDGTRLLMRRSDKPTTCQSWSITTASLLAEWDAELTLQPIELSWDGAYAAQSHDHKGGAQVSVWETATGRLLQNIELPGLSPRLRFSPRQHLLAATRNHRNQNVDETLFINPLSGTCVGMTSGHPMLLENCHTFSPDGRWFASISTDLSVSYQMNPVPSGTVFLSNLISLVA
jgi:hypothetical protein